MACYLAHTHGMHGRTTCAGCDWTKPAEDEKAEWQEKANSTGKEVWWRGEKFVPLDATGQPLPPQLVDKPSAKAGAREYKVITQRDEYFASKFNPEALQDLLNQHASQGWRVVSMTATDVGSFFGSFWAKGGGSTRQELVVLLEKVAE